MKYGYVIGMPVKVGEIDSGISTYRTNILNSEIAAAYIQTGAVKLFATEEDAAKYARNNRKIFGVITQPAYFYVEVKDPKNMKKRKEQCSSDCRDFVQGKPVGYIATYEASFYEVDALNLTPIRGHLSKNFRVTVELTTDAEPLLSSGFTCSIL